MDLETGKTTKAEDLGLRLHDLAQRLRASGGHCEDLATLAAKRPGGGARHSACGCGWMCVCV